MSSIKDVARHAGVSVATVSRTINSPNKVSEDTRKSVEKAILELNFTPNSTARDLRTSQTRRVIVLVPNISNPFFSNVIKGIQNYANTCGYSVLLGETHNQIKLERDYANMVLRRQADGIIQLSARNPFSEIKLQNEKAPPPWVNACECLGETSSPIVKIDNYQAMKDLTEHILEKGHKRLGVVLGPQESPLTQERLEGILSCLDDSPEQSHSLIQYQGDFSSHSGALISHEVASSPKRPTAIICMNDEMAFGLIHGLKQKNIKIPHDISVAGFDDIELAQYCDPPLTTIQQPSIDLGRTAMKILTQQIERTDQHNTIATFSTQLIPRESIRQIEN
ncbi:LacI family DNA-binding transcriptional regulator [Hirschia maritima]|uniref:LacI family DNA-binding transcriptional regulator n=1 Tax=Hirschia maritima TaxID=1121961 RepID=UPI0003729A3E|nr:LacI family DNA-binding transcriptional regulator [Hirschia maritima]